jgi:hypothetical protein
VGVLAQNGETGLIQTEPRTALVIPRSGAARLAINADRESARRGRRMRRYADDTMPSMPVGSGGHDKRPALNEKSNAGAPWKSRQ